MATTSNNTALAVKIQAAPGVFQAPDPVADAMPVSQVRLQIDGVTIANDEYTGSPIRQGDNVAGKRASLSYRIKIRGPGGADIPAANGFVAGRVLQAAKLIEVRNAAAIPAAPEAIGAGPTTSSVTLGAAAASTTGLYKAFPLLLTGKGATFKQRLTAIRSYTAAKVATLVQALSSVPAGNYQIPKFLGYMRSVTADEPLNLSKSLWLGGMRYDLSDAKISGFRIVVPVSTRDQAQNPEFEVNFDVTIADYVKQAAPAIPALGAVPLFRDGEQHIALTRVGGQNFSIDLGIQSEYPPNPNQPDGSDPSVLVGSTASLQMRRQFYAKDVLDTLALADAQTQHPFFAMWGNASGSIVMIAVPDARFNYQTPDLGGGVAMEDGELYIDAFDRGVAILFPYE